MLTRRTFIASAATPAALPFCHPSSPIERLWREHQKQKRFVDQMAGDTSDEAMNAAVSRWNAITMDLVSEPPRSLREMALQLHAIDLDPEWNIFVPTFLKHIEFFVGEAA